MLLNRNDIMNSLKFKGVMWEEFLNILLEEKNNKLDVGRSEGKVIIAEIVNTLPFQKRAKVKLAFEINSGKILLKLGAYYKDKDYKVPAVEILIPTTNLSTEEEIIKSVLYNTTFLLYGVN